MKPSRTRLDVALTERGLVETRSKAQALIMARRVTVNARCVDKPGTAIHPEDELRIVQLDHPWVGRGGIKLAHALREFGISLAGRTCLDIGASTGGFTDVMLESGAARVYAVDVGYGQIDASLRNDPRVVNRERVNARYLTTGDFDEAIHFVSIDVSFIPLKLILPPVAAILAPDGELVALIKPQFEVGKADVGKGGIVRDVAKRDAAVAAVRATIESLGFLVDGIIESPIKGAEGNVEYLAHAFVGRGAAAAPVAAV
jgi:23S rRNA (cytidine1920-2'-O)/16S rRNA (cytidine1409-2'-O)-methyltransferase